jgi:hypothetical protein
MDPDKMIARIEELAEQISDRGQEVSRRMKTEGIRHPVVGKKLAFSLPIRS